MLDGAVQGNTSVILVCLMGLAGFFAAVAPPTSAEFKAWSWPSSPTRPRVWESIRRATFTHLSFTRVKLSC